MPTSSEEYLATLGFDTSDVDSSVNQTITILGHLAEAFPQVQKNAEKAQTALGATGTSAKQAQTGVATLDKGVSSLSSGSLPRMRYALYDVSNALGIVGVALVGAAGLAYKTAIDFEADFAQVVRTTGVTGAAVDKLYGSLVSLSQTTPVNFADVSSIAAFGGQLGILPSQIAGFTKSVAEFSATTNVSVDDSATAFGRLNALLPDVKNNYNALGSAILNVGIHTVSTESQIIAISTRIAGIGASVGLTSSQIIGLSGALASLGIQPELAQGTLTRVFTKMQVAVQTDSAALEDFGRISGESGAQFAAAYKENAGQAFITLLNGIATEGDGAIGALQSLGITSTRDIPTLLKLSQNTDLVTRSFNLAADGAKKGTQLGDSYNIVAKTTAAQLKELANNAAAFEAALGKGGTAIGGFLQYLDKLLQDLTAIASNPVGNWVLGFGVLLVGLTGLTVLAGAAFLRLAANAAALLTIEGGGTGITGAFSAALAILTRTAGGAAVSEDALTVSTLASTGAMTAGTGAAGLFSAATGGAAIAANALKFSVAGLAVVLGLGLANWLLGLSDAAANNKLHFTDASQALAAYQKQIDAFSSTGIATVGPKGVLGNATTSRGAALQDVTGANAGVGKFATATGTGNLDIGYTQATESINKIDASMAKLVANGNAKTAAAEFKKWADAGKELGLSTADVTSKFPQYESATKKAAAATKAATKAQQDNTTSAADSIATITDVIDSTNKIQSSLYDLGSALGAGGDDFSAYSVNGRANLDALEKTIQAYTADAGGDSQALANNLQGLFNGIIAGGKVSASSLGLLSQAIAALGVTAIVPTTQNLSSLNQGFDDGATKAAKAGGAVAATAKQVRTLGDYANDLSGVFERAFDIRFGGSQALDTITKGWDAIRQAASDAQQKMADAQATLDGLASDKAADEYWLTIANAYGDTLRAAAIQADLAKNASDTASANSDLATAQDSVNTTLVGNTDAAIANRATIEGLVQNYQSYITALASSGATQAELSQRTAQLKQDFINQATQLGFNQSQLGTYASAFDDVTVAIGGVPRNITVTANTDPALQALNEFIAKAAAAGGAAGAAFSNAFGTPNDNAAVAKAGRAAQLQAQIASLNTQILNAQARSQNSAAYIQQLSALGAKLASGNYRSGGGTGSGNDWDVAGVVHRNEFVLNSTGAQMFPSNMLNAANSGIAPNWASAPSTAASSNQTPIVELSAYDRQLIADARTVMAMISPTQLATATSTVYSRQTSQGN